LIDRIRGAANQFDKSNSRAPVLFRSEPRGS
jgi:hypothetical protein